MTIDALTLEIEIPTASGEVRVRIEATSYEGPLSRGDRDLLERLAAAAGGRNGHAPPRTGRRAHVPGVPSSPPAPAIPYCEAGEAEPAATPVEPGSGQEGAAPGPVGDARLEGEAHRGRVRTREEKLAIVAYADEHGLKEARVRYGASRASICAWRAGRNLGELGADLRGGASRATPRTPDPSPCSSGPDTGVSREGTALPVAGRPQPECPPAPAPAAPAAIDPAGAAVVPIRPARRRYSSEERDEILDYAADVGVADAARRFGCSEDTIRGWQERRGRGGFTARASAEGARAAASSKLPRCRNEACGRLLVSEREARAGWCDGCRPPSTGSWDAPAPLPGGVAPLPEPAAEPAASWSVRCRGCRRYVRVEVGEGASEQDRSLATHKAFGAHYRTSPRCAR